MKEVDLNKAKGRNVVEISVADKRFRIVRVVTGVRQLYADYMTRTKEAIEKAASLEIREGETEEDYALRVEAVTEDVNSFVAVKREAYFGMLELILNRNGYELDRKWWIENTDEIDQQTFVEVCLTKDAPGEKKKMTGSV